LQLIDNKKILTNGGQNELVILWSQLHNLWNRLHNELRYFRFISGQAEELLFGLNAAVFSVNP